MVDMVSVDPQELVERSAAPVVMAPRGGSEAATTLSTVLAVCPSKQKLVDKGVGPSGSSLHGGARTAMTASWVSHASLKPQGLTIAAVKDRAIESLLQVWDVCALNCLPEDGWQDLMKYFLKRFGPDQHRFQAVSVQTGSNGALLLGNAVTVMECRVQSRL
eukprot:jgi/Tetstr1/457623/TSEL_044190.t1